MLNEINQGQNSGAQFDDEIDLLKLLGILLDGRYIIAAFVTMFATFGGPLCSGVGSDLPR